MGNTRPLLIFPCNGNALEALDCIAAGFEVVGFVDDTPGKQGKDFFGYPVFPRSVLAQRKDALVLAVPGSPSSFRQRRSVIASLGLPEDRFATVVHPGARVSSLARIGRNVLIMAGVVVTSNAVIGDHVCILPNSVVHHDAVVGAWSLIGSNVTVAGSVAVGENCYVGSGTSIMNGLEIGDGALIGLGTNLIRNVPAMSKVVGNPGRVIP